MKKIVILLALFVTSFNISAAPIGEQRARQIAEEFFAINATRSASSLELMWAGNNITEPTTRGGELNSALLYIYNRGMSDGYVIIAGDDTIAPIIAFAFDNAFDFNNMADATKAILDGWCRQISDARKTGSTISSTTLALTRADELLYDTAIWNQTDPYNREAPTFDGYRCYTGCVATALSIICYYNRWPEKGVGTTPAYSYTDYGNVNRTIAANTLGRTYNYNNMLADYNNGFTTTQANAVAALMKDIGTAVKMKYHYTGSGAMDTDALIGITTYLRYNKAANLEFRASYSYDEWQSALKQNLRGCGPTYYSGVDAEGGGHAFVVDGYKGDYFHFNFGWGGANNGYYLTPNITYYKQQMSMFNLVPDKDNSTTFRDNLVLCSATDANGNIVLRGILTDATKYVVGEENEYSVGGFFNFGPRPFSGTVKLVHCTADGTWKEELLTFDIADLSIHGFTYYEQFVNIALNESIDEGDRLRVYYKSVDSNEWLWARRYNEDAVNEIIICASPESVAENLTLWYDKAENKLYLKSPNAFQVDLDNGVASGAFAGHTTASVPSSLLSKGEHILKISNSGRSYELKLKL